MKRQGSSRGTAAILALACIGLGWVVYEQVQGSPGAANSFGAELAGKIVVEALPPVLSFAMPTQNHFVEIIERPLFSPNRRPPVIEESSIIGDTPPAGLLLEGVVMMHDQRLALIRPAGGGDVAQVSEGMQIDGWMVTDIHADNVTLQRDGVVAVLELDYKTQRPMNDRRREKTTAPTEPGASTEPATRNVTSE